MMRSVEFQLVALSTLRAHEEVEPEKVDELVTELSRSGVFVEPIWVARDALVILNGHHRVEALRRLGASKVPAWVIEYEGPLVTLERWSPGPPISKAEVVARAGEGRLYPPKTTRHRLAIELPACRVPLADLMPAERELAAQRVASRGSRRPGAGAVESG